LRNRARSSREHANTAAVWVATSASPHVATPTLASNPTMDACGAWSGQATPTAPACSWPRVTLNPSRRAHGAGVGRVFRTSGEDRDAGRAERTRVPGAYPAGHAQQRVLRLRDHNGDALPALRHRDEGRRTGLVGEPVEDGLRHVAQLRLALAILSGSAGASSHPSA